MVRKTENTITTITHYREIQALNEMVARQATEIDTLARQCEKKKLRIKDWKDKVNFQTDYVRTLDDRLKHEGEKAEGIKDKKIARLQEELEKKHHFNRDVQMMGTIGYLR